MKDKKKKKLKCLDKRWKACTENDSVSVKWSIKESLSIIHPFLQAECFFSLEFNALSNLLSESR